MLSVPTLLPVLLGATLAQPPQEPNRAVLEIIPLQHICAPRPMIEPPLWTTAMARQGDEGDLDLLGVGEQTPQFDPESILDFLQSLNGKALSETELALEAQGDTLIALGDSGMINRLRQQVRELSDIVTRPIEVEVTFWSAGDGAPSAAVLSPEDYARFAASHQPLWRRTSTTRSSLPVSLDSTRWTRYVQDVNAQIAQESAILDPETDAFFEGSNVLVLPHGLVGGDEFVAHVQFVLAERMGPVQHVTTGIPDSAQLDSVVLASLCGGFSGRLTNGGALCATMVGDGSCGTSAILTVRLASRSPPAAAKTVELGVFPISALTTAALTEAVGPPPTDGGLIHPQDMETPLNDSEEGFGQIDSDRLTDLLYSSLSDDDQEATTLQTGGGYLFAQGTEDSIARVEATLRGLQDRLLRTASVQHRISLDTPSDGAKPTVLHDLIVPTLLGRYATVQRRAETCVVANLNTEVAQDSKAVEPEVGLLQFGSWMRARVAGGDNTAHLMMLAQCSHCDLPEPRQMMPAGSLSLVAVTSQRIVHDGSVVAGQAIRHGDGPIVDLGGHQHRSAAVTTVRW